MCRNVDTFKWLRLRQSTSFVLAVITLFLVTTCDAQTDSYVTVPALGRFAEIGYMYDERSDKIIDTVFSSNVPSDFITEFHSPSTTTESTTDNSFEQLQQMFDISYNTAVNILLSNLKTRGAAKILNPNKKIKATPSGTLVVQQQTAVQRLQAFHERLKGNYNKAMLHHRDATHIVTGITWGARVAVTLKSSSLTATEKDAEKVKDQINEELLKLEELNSVTEVENSNFTISVNADVTESCQVPLRSMKDVQQFLLGLPEQIKTLNGGKGVPLEFRLTPIGLMREFLKEPAKYQIVAYNVPDFILREMTEIFYNFLNIEQRITNIQTLLASQPNCVTPNTTEKIEDLNSNFRISKSAFTEALKENLKRVRSGNQSADTLEELAQTYKHRNHSVRLYRRKLAEFDGALQKIGFCKMIEQEDARSQIEYFGLNKNLIPRINEESEKSVFVLFTKSDWAQNDTVKSTESLNTILRGLNTSSESISRFIVDCDFDQNFCNNLTDTTIHTYENGILASTDFRQTVRQEESHVQKQIGDLQTATETLHAAQERLTETILQNSNKLLVLENDVKAALNLTYENVQKSIDQHQEVQSNMSYLHNITRILQQQLTCVLNPCLNGGKCSFKNNERHCECSLGFLGVNCETKKDHCAGHRFCQHEGTCVDGVNSFTCNCAVGYNGIHCETDIDDCAGHNRCQNGGTCVDGVNSFTCDCTVGYNGIHCETDIDDCAGNNRCQNGGTCVDGTNTFTCVCSKSFIGNHCEHLNECVYPGTCRSLSTLSRDAKCRCREGYAPDPRDSRSCEPVNKNLNENATLIFGSYGGGVEQFSLSHQKVTRIQNHLLMVRALDVMYRTNTMFWSDTIGNIHTAIIRQGAAKTVVFSDSGSWISSLAVDWVHGHLYFADDNRDSISVANLDGSMKKVLFTTGVTNTRAIVVDPLSGWMYWADWTAKNIERAAMDGSGREVIANTEPKHPRGLALDMTQNRLYWTTNQYFPTTSLIHSMNVDGSDQTLVYEAKQPTFSSSNFMSITTFGDFVYWREYYTKSVYRTNKCGGGGATKIHSTAEQWDAYLTLQAYHFSKQPEGVNYCENRIGGQCSHLCFRIPSTGNQSGVTKCACPDGRALSFDQRTCT